ncbi:secretory phospholipase A2 receptor-like [Sander vitreus]
MEIVKLLNNTADLSKMVYHDNSYQAWIGLYNDHVLGNWRWSLSDPSFYKPGVTEFSSWASGEPNLVNNNRACTRLYKGQWIDDDCQLVWGVVCMDVNGSAVTFVFVNPMSWSDAQTYCREHHTDLASVRNDADNQKILEAIPYLGIVWIGLFRDTWTWSDGSNSTFRFWKNGQPNYNETCVAADFSDSGKWGEWSCDWKRAFICYGPMVPVSKKVMKVVKVKFENKNDLDPNVPAVMEAMLKQLQQKMRDQGLDWIKLSWRKQADGKVFHNEDKKTNKRRRKRDKL